jgi:O-antigen/teichoic acid export membrane protein
VSTLGKNTVWNLVGQAAPALAAVFTVPILIHGLGTERFGVLTLIWLIVGYFSIFDLGLGRALTQLLADRLGRDDHDAVAPLVWTAMGLMAALGLLGTAVAAILAPNVEHALKAPASLRVETLDSIYLLALSIPLVVSTAGLRGILEARQRFDLANVVRLASGVFTYVGPVLALLFSRSLVPITAVLVVGRLITWAAYLVMCVHELPDLKRGVAIQRAYVGPLLKFGGWMTVSNLISPILVYLDRFLIATVIGAAAVAYYVTPFEIVTRLLLLPWALSGVLFPLIASTFVSNRARSARLFSRGIRVTFLALFPFVLLVMAFAHEGLALWVGETIASHSTIAMRWLALGVFMNGVVQVPFATIQAAGRPDLTARIHLIELPLYLPALWWMAHRWGIEGAAVAWMFRGGLDMAIQYFVAKHLLPNHALNGEAREFDRATAVSAAAFAALSFAAAALVPTLGARLLVVVASLTGFVVLAWTRLLNADERIYVRAWANRASARFRVA